MMKILLPFALLILVACTPSALPQIAPHSPLYVSRVYLPVISGGCGMSETAAEFARLLMTDSRQRSKLVCNPALVEAANVRAESMARGNYFGHFDAQGNGPNLAALRAGCKLPYPPQDNNIESIAAGTPVPLAAFLALARSPSHAPHLFGEGEFFEKQTHLGVAVAYNPQARWKWYWSVLIAECQ